jgi:dUTP pyrophosphatase
MIRIARIRDVKMPVRKTAGAAGYDFYMPKIDEAFVRDFMAKEQNKYIDMLPTSRDHIVIPARSQALIPSGIMYEIPEGFALIAHNKSGVSTKKQVIFLADVGDDDYQGELHLSIFNLGSDPVIFHEGDPVVQFLLMPIIKDYVIEFSIDDVFTRGPSARGAGGFGSTGA